MIIITGGAGFIGSCIVSRLNEVGHGDLLIVDHFFGPEDIKRRNLEHKIYKEYLDKKDFLHYVLADPGPGKVEAVIHMGACSSTTLDDAKYFQENNFEYTCTLAQWALKHKLRFIYASSAATYGDGHLGYSDDDEVTPKLKPLNLYGESKHNFDLLVLREKLQDQVVGLKFFNVFGPNEYHKGDMRSVVAKAYQRVTSEGRIALFKSDKIEYADGEQKRDFIYVKDAVDIVLYFLEHREQNGIFNVGSGEARTWNDLARALFKAVAKPAQIDYVDMPQHLRSKYQYYTQADVTKLRRAGYVKPFTLLEAAVKDYAGYLSTNRTL